MNTEKEWKGMPECSNESLLPVKSIIVNFASVGHMLKFGKLIKQKITWRTKSLWFPEQEIVEAKNLRYIDES